MKITDYGTYSYLEIYIDGERKIRTYYKLRPTEPEVKALILEYIKKSNGIIKLFNGCFANYYLDTVRHGELISKDIIPKRISLNT